MPCHFSQRLAGFGVMQAKCDKKKVIAECNSALLIYFIHVACMAKLAIISPLYVSLNSHIWLLAKKTELHFRFDYFCNYLKV